jgi:hypothetical protein
MLSTTLSTTEIDTALHANLTALIDSFRDLGAALVLCLVAGFSLVHAVLRIVFAALGFLLWALALLIIFLYWLRAWTVKNSSSSLHLER